MPTATLAKLMNTSVSFLESTYGHLSDQANVLRKALAQMSSGTGPGDQHAA